MEAKFTALQIAALFVNVANSLPEDHIDNLKLNKLCYYAQGWHIAKFGTPLFSDRIEAWDYGPVIPSVYAAYKPCGREQIECAQTDFDESALTNDELALITDVYMHYGMYSSRELINMTHEQGTPWRKVHVPRENREIKISDMEEYFSNSNELDDMILRIPKDKIVTGISYKDDII